MSKKVVLAYSGGLDTTVALRWLQETQGAEVIAVAVDVGQGSDLESVRKKAIQSGALDAVVVDAAQEFAQEFVLPSLKANALYQGRYPLVSALSRPLIAAHLARVARETGAYAVAHGCTGKGNDQVRFEVSLGALIPEIEVLAPVREWGMTREQTIEYGLERGLPVPVGPSAPYSIDENLWGRAIECGALEDAMQEPPDEVWSLTEDPVRAPRQPAYAEIEFLEGCPVALDGEALSLPVLIARVAGVAGAYGVGRLDMIEDRVVGIKSREIYEVPGALALIEAHADLEEMTLDREVLRAKRALETRYAELVYEGMWFSPLREALDAFNASTQKAVTGTVRLRMEPGRARVVGRRSPRSLYDVALATYGDGDEFDQRAAEGFVKLWGLPVRTWARRDSR